MQKLEIHQRIFFYAHISLTNQELGSPDVKAEVFVIDCVM